MKNWIWWMFLLTLCVLACMLYESRSGDPRLAEAQQHYLQGEQASSIAERTSHFNRALSLFLSLEKKYHPLLGTGQLYRAIGDTFYQLENFPEALLYYEKALQLMPRSETLQINMGLARKKLFLPETHSSTKISSLIISHCLLSLSERLQLFFILSVLLFLCASFYIWSRKKRSFVFLRSLFLVMTTFCLALTTASILYTHYFSTIPAIVIHATLMRTNAGMTYSKVGEAPLPAGTKVEVLGFSPEGRWMKVLTPNGAFGYVQGEAIRLIEVE